MSSSVCELNYIIDLLRKSFLPQRSQRKSVFKGGFSKVSVCSVAVLCPLMQEVKYYIPLHSAPTPDPARRTYSPPLEQSLLGSRLGILFKLHCFPFRRLLIPIK